jgi:hypothetical protein
MIVDEYTDHTTLPYFDKRQYPWLHISWRNHMRVCPACKLISLSKTVQNTDVQNVEQRNRKTHDASISRYSISVDMSSPVTSVCSFYAPYEFSANINGPQSQVQSLKIQHATTKQRTCA